MEVLFSHLVVVQVAVSIVEHVEVFVVLIATPLQSTVRGCRQHVGYTGLAGLLRCPLPVLLLLLLLQIYCILACLLLG